MCYVWVRGWEVRYVVVRTYETLEWVLSVMHIEKIREERLLTDNSTLGERPDAK